MFIYIKMDAECNETWGTPLAEERGCEALSLHENTRNPQKKHQKKMILKMNQDTYRNLLGWQESPGITFDTTRLHKTACQEVNSLKISKNLSELWLGSTLCVLIQDLGWTQLESTSKIIVVNVENSPFGYNLIFEIWISEGRGPVAWGPPDFCNLPPGGECFAPCLLSRCPVSPWSHYYSLRASVRKQNKLYESLCVTLVREHRFSETSIW